MEMDNYSLAEQLISMAQRDQGAIMDVNRFKKVARENAANLKKLVIRKWPSIGDIGQEGCDAAWLIAQHADHDIAFQKRCLRLIKNAVKKKEIPAHYYAYLYDRVCLNTNLPYQKFGTQIRCEGKGCFPYPPTEKKNADLDSLRNEYGLPPLAEYLRLFQKK